MKSYYVAKSTTSGFIGTFTSDQIESLLKSEVIKPDFVATDCTGPSYSQLMESGIATWVPVSQLQRPADERAEEIVITHTSPISESPTQPPECPQESVETGESGIAWKLIGAVLGAAGLVIGARGRGILAAPLDVLKPAVPVLLTSIGLIGANVGAIVGLLVFRFRKKRDPNSVLNNSAASSPPPQEGYDMSAKRILRSLVGLNAAFTLGGLIGGFVGCASLTSPPTKDRYEGFDPFRLIGGLFKLFENLFQLVMFVTAGALIAALVRSLYFILFRLR